MRLIRLEPLACHRLEGVRVLVGRTQSFGLAMVGRVYALLDEFAGRVALLSGLGQRGLRVHAKRVHVLLAP